MATYLQDITVDELKAALEYNPTTGQFTRKSSGKPAGSKGSKGYVQILLNYKSYKAHRLAWLYAYGEWPDKQVDHINLDRADNRLSNLRLADNSENNANNTRVRSNSGAKGVTLQSNGLYYVQIVAKQKNYYLGAYKTIEEAVAAYNAAAITHFGQFANLSVVPSHIANSEAA